jgi:uncharacterized membrane protein (Fun14 family)
MDETIIFFLKTLGLGLLTGFIFGYLFKKVTKIVIFLIALAVILVVVLGHNEILEIDWLSINDKGLELFDQYADEHGEHIKIFLHNAPFTIGLIIRGLIGLNKG